MGSRVKLIKNVGIGSDKYDFRVQLLLRTEIPPHDSFKNARQGASEKKNSVNRVTFWRFEKGSAYYRVRLMRMNSRPSHTSMQLCTNMLLEPTYIIKTCLYLKRRARLWSAMRIIKRAFTVQPPVIASRKPFLNITYNIRDSGDKLSSAIDN